MADVPVLPMISLLLMFMYFGDLKKVALSFNSFGDIIFVVRPVFKAFQAPTPVVAPVSELSLFWRSPYTLEPFKAEEYALWLYFFGSIFLNEESFSSFFASGSILLLPLFSGNFL